MQLIKDRKVFDSKISEMEERTNEMMIAKFGRIVDLEKLETITVNRQIEELKEKLRLTEIQCAEELVEWDVSKIFIQELRTAFKLYIWMYTIVNAFNFSNVFNVFIVRSVFHL